ncbi:MAG TPA: AraC family transcriptional regulator [Steroidobacteraceae bacterium]|jgi:AraC-type DNA-binding domain-containing proteins|nr:AraC family transcriptional regulator [Steroidobacteraceae bacterium]
MDNSTLSIALTGVVPAVCDAEAGVKLRIKPTMYPATGSGSGNGSVSKIRSVMAELCCAIRSALDDERSTAEDSLRRAAEILQELGETPMTSQEEVRGGLSPWQLRKVTRHIEAQLDQPIRNEDLAALVRLNPSHFGRAFRNSCGESPHEYVIRRRVERAQGLMLSTDASLSEIALDCGLADQAHLSRLFRRIVGETPRAWRRARSGAPAECV